jgi:FkbH-like protein
MVSENRFLVALSASFTAEPLQSTLDFWMSRLRGASAVEFAPFNQIFQSLLDPASLFAANKSGVNVVLIRWQDLGTGSTMTVNAHNLLKTIRQTAGSLPSPIIAVSCPCSESFLASEGHARIIGEVDAEMERELRDVSGLHLLRAAEILTWYPVERIHDAESDRLGSVPFTAEYFTALGTSIARKLDAIGRAPIKVAVLDLDNTLWQGVAGEDGPRGVTVDEHRAALQSFFLEKRGEGTLLGICSKNNEEDAIDVFRNHPEMPLQLDHFVARRINWEQKSNNLRSLASELSLGTDSFAFIDDDDKECAEVIANCPEVLTLQIPRDVREITKFLNHVWAFDRLTVTKEDRQRNESYRQEQLRSSVIRQATTLEEFIAALDLRISIQLLTPDQIPRVSQLTLRTNQFNTTGMRRTEAEVARFTDEADARCLTVDVSDRFGDYGLVGALFYRMTLEAIVVESFLMSCRVLGRGVEHAVLRHLGEIALGIDQEHVKINFIPTKKNAPARTFLDGMKAVIRDSPTGTSYVLSGPDARDAVYRPGEKIQAETVSTAPTQGSRSRIDYAEIAQHFHDVAKIMAATRPLNVVQVAASDSPRSELEHRLASIWAKVLRVSNVGINDSFFDLGGSSLLAVELLTDIIEKFERRDLTLSTILEAPTVARFAAVLTNSNRPKFSCLVPLRETGSRPPFFSVHGVGGNVLSQRTLALNLPPDQPFWSIQARGLDGSTVDEDLRETAALYIQEIKAIQPHGPYFIGGGSAGGLFAYEMAQQLTGSGGEVGLLALGDTFNIKYPMMISRSRVLYCHVRFIVQRTVHHLASLARTPPLEWPRRLSSAFGAVAWHLRPLLGRSPRESSEPPIFSAGESPTLQHDETGLTDVLIRVRDRTRRAVEQYVPKPYSGKLTLFTAKIKAIEPYQDRILGWGPLVSDVEVHEVPGDHLTIGDQKEFARALDACLREAQNRAAVKREAAVASAPASEDGTLGKIPA